MPITFMLPVIDYSTFSFSLKKSMTLKKKQLFVDVRQFKKDGSVKDTELQEGKRLIDWGSEVKRSVNFSWTSMKT